MKEEDKIDLIKSLAEATLESDCYSNYSVTEVFPDRDCIHITIKGMISIKTIETIGKLFGDDEVGICGKGEDEVTLIIENNNIKCLIN